MTKTFLKYYWIVRFLETGYICLMAAQSPFYNVFIHKIIEKIKHLLIQNLIIIIKKRKKEYVILIKTKTEVILEIVYLYNCCMKALSICTLLTPFNFQED